MGNEGIRRLLLSHLHSYKLGPPHRAFLQVYPLDRGPYPPHIISRKCYCNINRIVSMVLATPKPQRVHVRLPGLGGTRNFRIKSTTSAATAYAD